MAQVEPPTKISEPVPAIVRPGRPIKDKKPLDLPVGQWSEQAVKVLEERYLLKNDAGEVIETPDQMCWRVAWDIAAGDPERAKDYYNLMVFHEFLPNSPTLMNAGKNNGLQYSACYVIPVEDSIEGIFDGIKYQAIIHKSGGGTGFSFSRLRPSNARVRSTKGVASGPVSFMKIYDAATEQIKQGGSRRGANMGILRVDHPDILEFIHCKEAGGITNFNISVAVTEVFLKAYREDTNYDLVNPKTKEVAGSLSARKVMEEIADGAWRTGDPGMIFIDRINAGTGNPVPSLGPIEATNPCGEQQLYPFDACNLGSIFLKYFIKDHQVDWEKLERVTKLSVRFLDDVIERNPFPLEQIRKTVTAIRRIGLGVGGWADMLIELGIPYNSEEAFILGEKIMKFINAKGHEASQELAAERGPFPMWNESIYKNDKPIRNSTVTTIAPTGTIAIIANASSGIEPLFAVAFKHYVKTNALERSLYFFNPLFEAKAAGQSWYTEEVKEKIAKEGTVTHLAEIPEEIKKIFVTAHDLNFSDHVKMQAAFQKGTDNAVSKTINLPNGATREDIKNAYLQAYESGCLGITVYRDGCKAVQVLNLGTKDKQAEVEVPKLKPRPVIVDGSTYRIETPMGTAFITVNHDFEKNPFEVFISVGKAGSEVAALAEALGRLISTTLRFGNHLPAKERAREIVDQLAGIGGSGSVGFGKERVRSLPDAVAKAITMHFGLNNPDIPIKEEIKKKEEKYLFATVKKDLCPSCGAAAFIFEEGCSKCHSCGYSKC